MKKQKTKVTCIGLDENGKGIVNIKGKEYFVSNLLPNETAIVEMKRTKYRTFIDVVKIEKASKDRVQAPCIHYGYCGGCQLQHMSQQAQDNFKQKIVVNLLKSFGKVQRIITMEEPYHYRNKVQTTFSFGRKKQIISGVYQKNSHRVIDMEKCLIHDRKADEIIQTIKGFMKSFKFLPFDEDTGRGFLRHVLIKRGFATNQVMVVLVTSSKMFPGKNNFIKALVKAHPEISTIVMNINNRKTSVVLGREEITLYGKGYIEDVLCGKKFQISAKSFYQINPVQTEILYNKAIEMARLKGNETVMDAYCGIGTISLIVSEKVKKVIGVELNKDAVRDAIRNAKNNQIKNTRFYEADASDFMVKLAHEKKKIDVVMMDPPRAGSDQKFLSSLIKLAPQKVVYVSCNPVTMKRDLHYLRKNGYKVGEIQPVDMFPQTSHVECVALLTRE